MNIVPANRLPPPSAPASRHKHHQRELKTFRPWGVLVNFRHYNLLISKLPPWNKSKDIFPSLNVSFFVSFLITKIVKYQFATIVCKQTNVSWQLEAMNKNRVLTPGVTNWAYYSCTPQKKQTWASFFSGGWGRRGGGSDGRGKRKTQKGAWLQKCQHLQVVTADCWRVITTLSDSRRSAKSINPIQRSVLAQHHSLQFLIQTDYAQAFINYKPWRNSKCLLKVEKKALANAVSS